MKKDIRISDKSTHFLRNNLPFARWVGTAHLPVELFRAMETIAVLGEAESNREVASAEPKELSHREDDKKGIVTALDLQKMQKSFKDDLAAEFKSSQLEIKRVLEEVKTAWMEMEVRLNTQADLVTLMKELSHSLTNIKVFQKMAKCQKAPASLNGVTGDDGEQTYPCCDEMIDSIHKRGSNNWQDGNEEYGAVGKECGAFG